MIGILITQLNDDDRAFMLNLYKNYYNLARKTIYSITHDNQKIEDLINDAFVKLIEKISKIRTLDCCSLSVYVVYTVRSVSINHIKHKEVENKHMYYSENMDLAKDILDYEDDTIEKLIRQEEIQLLNVTLSKLPQNQRDLLYFKYILEMSDKQIAEILGIAPSSVRQYLTRARREAKRLIEKESSDHVM
jgi:RNA polymerase sigma-70 factor, ECF subfamily